MPRAQEARRRAPRSPCGRAAAGPRSFFCVFCVFCTPLALGLPLGLDLSRALPPSVQWGRPPLDSLASPPTPRGGEDGGIRQARRRLEAARFFSGAGRPMGLAPLHKPQNPTPHPTRQPRAVPTLNNNAGPSPHAGCYLCHVRALCLRPLALRTGALLGPRRGLRTSWEALNRPGPLSRGRWIPGARPGPAPWFCRRLCFAGLQGQVGLAPSNPASLVPARPPSASAASLPALLARRHRSACVGARQGAFHLCPLLPTLGGSPPCTPQAALHALPLTAAPRVVIRDPPWPLPLTGDGQHTSLQTCRGRNDCLGAAGQASGQRHTVRCGSGRGEGAAGAAQRAGLVWGWGRREPGPRPQAPRPQEKQVG
jgi:hypothetical protein